jgi:hypothetical protein
MLIVLKNYNRDLIQAQYQRRTTLQDHSVKGVIDIANSSSEADSTSQETSPETQDENSSESLPHPLQRKGYNLLYLQSLRPRLIRL